MSAKSSNSGGGRPIVVLSGARKSGKATEVRLEAVGKRDLISVVTASGKIEAETKVDVSADITGRIVKLGVREGDMVKKGELLVQIDPSQYQSIVSRAEAFLQSSEANLLQVKANRDQAKRSLDRALELRKTNPNLISAEAVEQAQQAYDVAVATYNSSDSQVDQARASLQEARSNLSKTSLYAPISGRVTRLAVEEGEVAVPGTRPQLVAADLPRLAFADVARGVVAVVAASLLASLWPAARVARLQPAQALRE